MILKDVLIVTDGYEYDPILDEVTEWECYAVQEGLTDEQLQELLKNEIINEKVSE